MAQAQDQPSRHYLTQAGLTVALSQAIARIWPQVDVRNPGGTLPGFRRDAALLIRQFSRSSATVAARNYAQARRDAGIRSQFTVRPADVPNLEQIDKSLGWATSGLYDQTLLDPATSEVQVRGALDNARTQAEGVSARLVLNTGRETTVQAVTEDRQAIAWARETRPGACSFCAMLASRFAVYKSEQTAGRSANEKFIGEGEFKFHNHCHCIAVPVFNVYEPTAHARQWHADWYALKKELGHAPSLNQWRQHFEGRPVDGLTPKP